MNTNTAPESDRYKLRGPNSLENPKIKVMPLTAHLKKPVQPTDDNANSVYYEQYGADFTVTHDADNNIINIERPTRSLKKPKTNQGVRMRQSNELCYQDGQKTDVVNSRSSN
jgi:hypothetical protein